MPETRFEGLNTGLWIGGRWRNAADEGRFDPAAPFGGVKQSGLGREGGHEGVLEYLETQYVSVNW